MCGIVGYVGHRSARELLLSGLKRLEYRGYDSAGISVIADGGIESIKAVGKLDALEAKLNGIADSTGSGPEGGAPEGGVPKGGVPKGGVPKGDGHLEGTVNGVDGPAVAGIGHTRWATHGRVSEENAHPHFDTADKIHVVVNGIIENYQPLKVRLTDEGGVFTSETDAEVVAHLVSHHYKGNLAQAVRSAYDELDGRFAFVAMSAEEPELLVGVRRETPLLLGRGEHEQFIASAVPAFLAQTRTIQQIEDGDIAELRPDGVRILAADGQEVQRPLETVDWDEETAEKGGFETFTLKEIHEQPEAVAETIADRISHGAGVNLEEESFDEALLQDVGRIVIVACGTAYHAGLVGRYAIEQWARVPVEMDIASEYRYRQPIIGPADIVIGISQSGETADTLAAMRLAREAGARVIAITNVMGSQITREADGVLFTRAGMEIGVAATKTFVCQAALLYLLALRLAELRGTLTSERIAELVGQIRQLPHQIAQLTGSPEADGDPGLLPQVTEIAKRYGASEFFLYMGRNIGLPIALEGALKLKEIAYIATDAYAAGEMKHGPIALLDDATPVVCLATDSPVLEKMAANMQEVRARGATVIAIITEGNPDIEGHLDIALEVPAIDWMLQPILAVIPLQMLAYQIGRRRGLNVDQPRNLAKTVTVE
ncbi:MAG TPA: glutamine--fructose-6-phosphate transaminase (isomerizing) [Solirubrobacteraceae bacterium]